MTGLRYFIETTIHPERFHGHNKKPPFFEGWYFKLINADETQRYAIIPGVFIGEDSHAFIQVLNGNLAQSTYHRFDASQFWASRNAFHIRIANNEFTPQAIQLNLDDPLGRVQGIISFENLSPWPVSILSPGIMGWYAWVPRMECYHGVLSMDHGLRGKLEINDQAIDFEGGRGYIEKDWGKSFPKGYVWFQSNHFDTPETSLTASVAVIPWLGSSFRGFIIGFWYQNQLYRFATYLGSVIESLEINDTKVHWLVKNQHHSLEMTATRDEGGLLHEPTGNEMLQRVEETMLANVEVRLSQQDGRTLFYEVGRNLAMEVQGDIPLLLSIK